MPILSHVLLEAKKDPRRTGAAACPPSYGRASARSTG
jgi:hypothetical protein